MLLCVCMCLHVYGLMLFACFCRMPAETSKSTQVYICFTLAPVKDQTPSDTTPMYSWVCFGNLSPRLSALGHGCDGHGLVVIGQHLGFKDQAPGFNARGRLECTLNPGFGTLSVCIGLVLGCNGLKSMIPWPGSGIQPKAPQTRGLYLGCQPPTTQLVNATPSAQSKETNDTQK